MAENYDTEKRPDELVADLGWLRRVARALVHDAATAEDVAQDAWLAASEHPPATPGPMRPWLRSVVGNLVRMRHRSNRRRQAREFVSATLVPPDPPSPAEIVERVELQRVLADEVLALREPYRTTVLLRFFTKLSSAEIARRLGVPDSTVRRRLKIALDELRARLDTRNDGPGSGWLAALVPFARLPASGPAAVATLGVLSMKKLTVVVVLLIVVAAVALLSRGRGPSKVADARVSSEGRALRGSAGGTQAMRRDWLSQPGVAPRRIAGHVSAAEGPVGGAIVRLALISAPGAIEQIAERRSSVDGAFDFGLQPAASFVVSAQASQHVSISQVVEVADPTARPDALTLRLGACRSRLYGAVLDASGGAIPRARITERELGSAESDERGEYSVCMPDQNSRVRVEAEGYGSVSLPFRLWGALRHDFVLVPEAVLVGQVVSEGAPVVGARVTARPDDSDSRALDDARWTTTGDDGRFQINGLAPGRFRISAISDGLGLAVPVFAVARPAVISPEIRLTLDRLAEVRGRVVLKGRPVGGARVVAIRDNEEVSATSFSQPDGSFVLSRVPQGAVRLTARPYAVSSPKTVMVNAVVVDSVVLELATLATLRGHVTRQGRPVEGADVTAVMSRQHTRTDESGAFVIEGIPAGNNLIHAASLEARAAAEDQAITLSVGDDRTLELELEHDAHVTGIVVDENTQPVSGVYVRFARPGGSPFTRGGESMTDERGMFDASGMTTGDYLAEVYPAPLPAHPFSAAHGAFPLIHVPRNGAATGIVLAIQHVKVAIRGTIVDDTGAAVADASVTAVGGMDYGTMAPPSSISDARGRFEISGLAHGTYRVHAHAADGSEGELRGIEAGGEPTTIKLTRPGAIDARLLGFSSTPQVELRGGPRGGARRVLVDAGHASVTELPAGRYILQAKAGAELDSQSVDVRAGETAYVALRSRGLGRIEGRVIEHGSNAPVVGMRCDAMLSTAADGPLSPDQTLQAVTDGGGQFSVAAPIGRVRVVCAMWAGGPLSLAGTDVEVAGDRAATVDLVAVRDTRGRARSNPGFVLARGVLPLTVNVVMPGGPAEAAGLLAGDHLVAIDGASLRGMLPVGAATLLGNHAPGTTVVLAIERGSRTETISVVTSGVSP
jgi:RNA polymerase sigma factor (sigma-70 family)